MDGFFGIGTMELVLVAVIALVVLGPERLPSTLRSIAKFIRQIRAIYNELTAQFSDEFKILEDINPQKLLRELGEELTGEETPKSQSTTAKGTAAKSTAAKATAASKANTSTTKPTASKPAVSKPVVPKPTATTPKPTAAQTPTAVDAENSQSLAEEVVATEKVTNDPPVTELVMAEVATANSIVEKS